ncbi:pirin family protein [Marinobacter changyiensis]|uniref:pirin family protein n=1 Tax=Marinobacter changyiensis TaxID=2604091 RepID=UPI0012645C8D|nr:pirin family protein [Marinobacter changyiensis]
MINVRFSNERGHAKHGWLDSRHTFSFAEYYDPQFMGFSDLRVINDDWVDGGAGFGAHPHKDMEIITYVLEGTIAHKDTMNNVSQLQTGEVQVMSAGKGVFHSEFNASETEKLNFLQIWIIPNEAGSEPRYAQKDFSGAKGITLVVSPNGRAGSVPIRQDANVYQVKLEGEKAVFHPGEGRVYYVQVARGEMTLNETPLASGDGAYITGEEELEIEADKSVEALLFELRGR